VSGIAWIVTDPLSVSCSFLDHCKLQDLQNRVYFNEKLKFHKNVVSWVLRDGKWLVMIKPLRYIRFGPVDEFDTAAFSGTGQQSRRTDNLATICRFVWNLVFFLKAERCVEGRKCRVWRSFRGSLCSYGSKKASFEIQVHISASKRLSHVQMDWKDQSALANQFLIMVGRHFAMALIFTRLSTCQWKQIP